MQSNILLNVFLKSEENTSKYNFDLPDDDGNTEISRDDRNTEDQTGNQVKSDHLLIFLVKY